MQSARVAVILFAASVAVGCADGTGGRRTGSRAATDSAASSWPEPVAVRDLDQVRRYPTVGWTLMPPGAAVARISPQAAYDACAASHRDPAPCPGGKVGPTILFAVAVNDLRPGDSAAPRPVWILRWDDVMFQPVGAPPTSDSRPATATPSVWMTLIDATSGESLGAFQTNVPDA